MPRKNDIRLGQLLIQRQWCSLRHVSEALKIQASYSSRGRALPLGEILVTQNFVSKEHLMQALGDLGVLTMRCADCHVEYSISEFDPELKYDCRDCGSKLDLAEVRNRAESPIPFHSTTMLSVDSADLESSMNAAMEQPVSPLPARDHLIGKVFGGCKIIEKIAAGGMGVVYKAQQLNLNRLVAVKVLSKELASDESFVRRFIEEARAAAHLNHGNIVHINDVGDYQGVFYFTMEYVDGANLKGLLKERGRLSIPQALRVMIQVCRALQHAHARGIVHRDIKPENIMITRDGVVKLADLGLAKRVSPNGAENLTQTGSILGTPFYMAPEQAKNFSKADARSDIYSLGVTFFKTMTGKVPFSGRTPIEVMIRVIDGNRPKVSELREDVPAEVEGIVDRMMRKNPKDRYQSVDDLIGDLSQAFEEIYGEERETDPLVAS